MSEASSTTTLTPKPLETKSKLAISKSRLSGMGDAGEFASTSRLSQAFDFMERRRIYTVVYEGLDLTPENISTRTFAMMDDNFTHAAFAQAKGREAPPDKTKSADSNMADSSDAKVFETTISPDNIAIDQSLDTEVGASSFDMDTERAPSAFYLPLVKPVTKYPPRVLLILKETETIELFTLPALSFEKGTPESVDVEADNEFYAYITVGKGRNRKTINAETQTPPLLKQTRHALAPKPQKRNAMCFASLWDMFDTYEKLKLKQAKEAPDEMVMYQSPAAHLLRRKPPDTYDVGDPGEQNEAMKDLLRNSRFMDAIMITSRVLSLGSYEGKQKKMRGLFPTNPLDLDLLYIYTMKEMWVYVAEELNGSALLCACLNPANEDIIAIGYGSFFYGQGKQAAVCIWCSKNPRSPERLYKFDSSVTSLAFSPKNSNNLACGFENGDVLILDVISYKLKIVAKTKRTTNPCFEPIWAITWGARYGQEYIMTACQDGRIFSFTSTSTHELLGTKLMRVCSVEGKIRGLQLLTSYNLDVPITRNPAARCLVRHPEFQTQYFVGTGDGCVHKCTTNYRNQHISVFKAHTGNLYHIVVCPFWKDLIATSGADWTVRVWALGIEEPLITLNCNAAVTGVAWCPINSTLIVTVSGNLLMIWDLRRKVYVPSATYTFDDNVVLTYVKFLPSGESILVGDSSGRMYTFFIEDVPIPAFYQLKLLEESIRKALVAKPSLLKELEKIYNF